jgi:hypothetical protein
VSNGKITVRPGPTYEQDLKRLSLKADDLKAVTDAIDDIVKALSESPNNPDKRARAIHSRRTVIAVGNAV